MAIPRAARNVGRKPFRYHSAPAAVQVDGLTEAYAALDGLPDAFVEVFQREAGIGTDIIVSEAQRRVPVDEGELYDSIASKMRGDGLQFVAGSFGDTEDEARHAPHVELGTQHHPAQPWLYPAYLTGARYIRKSMKKWGDEAGAAASGLRVRSRGKRRRRSR